MNKRNRANRLKEDEWSGSGKKTSSLRRMGFKYSLLPTLLLLVSIVLVAYLHTRREHKNLKADMENRAYVLMRHFSQQYIDAILEDDGDAMNALTNTLRSNEQIEYLRAYDLNGICVWRLRTDLRGERLARDRLEVLHQGAPFLAREILFQNQPFYELVVPLLRGVKPYGFLKVEFPLTEFYEKLADDYYLLGIVAAGFVIGGILWTWMISTPILRPIARLSKAMKKVADGDMSPVPLTSHRELALLTENFNQMVGELRRSRAEISRHQATLEEGTKRARMELEETHRILFHSEKLAAVGELAAGVAHEINNPLTGIRMLSQLLEDELREGEARANLRKIVDHTLRCQKIVRGLLRFARDREVNYRAVNINNLLEGSLKSVSQKRALDKIEVVKKFPPDPLTVECDAEQIEEVFTNIILNAVEAMQGEGKLTLGTSFTNGLLKVAICDTGCGIPPEDLNKIFDPFYTSTKSGLGSGLGLSVSYGIAREHQGTIEVESKVGEGSTFTVCLPRKGERKEGQCSGTGASWVKMSSSTSAS